MVQEVDGLGPPREPDPAATFQGLAGEASGNEALWLASKRGEWRRGPSPVPRARGSEVVVRNRAIALNPVDWLMPLMGDFIAPWLAYPAVLGSDVAGEVEAVGEAVTRFKVGDRVVGHAAALERSRNRAAEGAFQRLTVLSEHMVAPIPAGMRFADAAVLPLGLSTAACGLFGAGHLALRPPVPRGESAGETVLIWGASTSVGSNAVQLAAAAGYDVVATSSPKNFDYVRRLGARRVCDYQSPTAVDDLVREIGDGPFAGAIAIGAGSARACVAVAGACGGRRSVAMVTPAVSFDGAPAGRRRALWLVPTVSRLVAASLSLAVRARWRGVRVTSVWGGALIDDAIGPMIYKDYLPRALEDGRHAAAPPPLVAGDGLAAIPAALGRLRAGISARKVVVTL